VTAPGRPGGRLLRWRRAFRGEEPELRQVRLWLTWLLPEHPCRDDVISVAVELSTNAIRHTTSRGRWFVVEVSWHPPAVRVAVADYGGDSEPRVIDDLAAEHGRGLLLVRGLSLRTGVVGDRGGRLIWADIAWKEDAAPIAPSEDPYEAMIREGQAALARSYAGTPAWFGRATLQWWALPARSGLVSAPTAHELAALLLRQEGMPPPSSPTDRETAEVEAHVRQRAQGSGGPPLALQPNRGRLSQDQRTAPHRRDERCTQPGVRAGRPCLAGALARSPVPAVW
jgi:Histidine kinase-like ATPase domain